MAKVGLAAHAIVLTSVQPKVRIDLLCGTECPSGMCGPSRCGVAHTIVPRAALGYGSHTPYAPTNVLVYCPSGTLVWPHLAHAIVECGCNCSQNTFAPANFGTVPEWHVWPKRHTHRIVLGCLCGQQTQRSVRHVVLVGGAGRVACPSGTHDRAELPMLANILAPAF